jgi:hypothetical protein
MKTILIVARVSEAMMSCGTFSPFGLFMTYRSLVTLTLFMTLTYTSSFANLNCPNRVPRTASCGCATGSRQVFVCQGLNGGGCEQFVFEIYCSADCALGSAGPGTCFASKTSPSSPAWNFVETRMAALQSFVKHSGQIVGCANSKTTLEHWVAEHREQSPQRGF